MDKQKDIKVESVNIKIGGREINLSVEEAKKLKSALEDLFGKEVVHEYLDKWYWRPYQQYPLTPFYWGTVNCQATNAGITADATNCVNLCIA
jgi:hypothetical protein